MEFVPESVRRERIGVALQDHKEKADAERLRVPWKSGHENLPVVELPLALVLLNPSNHRIQSQLESHPLLEGVRADPYTQESQQVLATILAEQVDGFDDLCRNLREEGQRDPGIVTRAGLLINANRRVVALRAIGAEHVRVAVLPLEDGEQELAALEESLQMQRDFKVDYTFTNWLLYVQERVQKGIQPDRLALRLGWAASSNQGDMAKGTRRVQQHLRVLATVRRLQALASTRLPLTVFDSKQIALEELDNAVEALGPGSPAAERLLQMRAAAMLCDVGYRELRHIDEYFVDEYLYEHLSEDSLFSGCADRLTSAAEPQPSALPAGVDLLVSGSDDLAERSPEPLLRLVVDAISEGRVELPSCPDGQRWVLQGDNLDGTLGQVINDAVEEAKDAHRHSDALAAPLAYVEGARKKIQKACDALDRVHEHAGLDYGALKYSSKKLAKEADDLHSRVDGSC